MDSSVQEIFYCNVHNCFFKAHAEQAGRNNFLLGRVKFGIWEQGQDLNLRPSGYEPDELPDCSTLLQKSHYNGEISNYGNIKHF